MFTSLEERILHPNKLARSLLSPFEMITSTNGLEDIEFLFLSCDMSEILCTP